MVHKNIKSSSTGWTTWKVDPQEKDNRKINVLRI
jgi:hypothetical protein